jgi:7,8-dihydro-6-hydroxymethylpterin-pyrophosphokinase
MLDAAVHSVGSNLSKPYTHLAWRRAAVSRLGDCQVVSIAAKSDRMAEYNRGTGSY